MSTPVPVASRRRLSPAAAFYLVGSVTLSLLAGASAPTPLYAIYQAEWGFSATMLTVAFGIYGIAVLLALLVTGRISDHLGRRPVLISALAMQGVAMLVFEFAAGLPELLLGRVIQGLSAGLALAAVGAGLLDLDRVRGAVANSVAPALGTALGGLIAAVMVAYLPAPTHLVYILIGVILAGQALGLVFVAETAEPHPGTLASLRPRFSVPTHARSNFFFALPAVVSVWALAGFYASLGPTLVHEVLRDVPTLMGGVALFILAGFGALAVLALQKWSAVNLTRLGAGALLVGVSLVIQALAHRSIALYLLGTAIAGSGFGVGFQGALRSLVSLLAPSERAGALSILFVVAYLAMCVPAVFAGVNLTRYGDILATTHWFAGAVMVLALLTLLSTFRRRRVTNATNADLDSHHPTTS